MAVVIFVGRRLVSYRGVAGGAPVAVGWHGERVEFEQAQLVALGRDYREMRRRGWAESGPATTTGGR